MSQNATPPLAVLDHHDVFSQVAPTFKQKVYDYINGSVPSSITPAGDNSSFDYGSASRAPRHGKDSPSSGSLPDFTDGASLDELFKEHNTYRSRMRLIQFRALIYRCQVLQCAVNILERKPRTDEVDSDVHESYSKIYHFASKARKLAEGLENGTLQARSEYWAGRGCGGLRDWQAAIMHFANAIKLDTPYTGNHKKFRHRGLLSNEREDVNFLLQNVTKHCNEWTCETKPARKSLYQVDPEDIGLEAPRGPRWAPYHDWMKHAAKQQLEKNKRTGKPMNHLLNSEGQLSTILGEKELKMIRRRLAKPGGKSIFRRTLSADEWFYILHGDAAMKNRSLVAKSETKFEAGNDRLDKSISFSLPPSIASSKQASPGIPQRLCDELQINGYQDGEETPPHPVGGRNTPPSPSSGSLQGRRKIEITPIRTDCILDESEPDDQTSKLGSGSVMADDNSKSEENLIGRT
jgi:hypothetical protein